MKKNKFVSSLLVSSCLITLAACGGKSGSSSHSVIQKEELDDHGIYRAVLSPLNASVAGATSGTVEIKIDGDDVVVKSNVKNAPAGVKHLQNVTLLSSCPAAATDAGSFVGATSVGQILIPLDSDLSEQLNGMSFGPIANSSGTYVYRRSTSLTQMMADLHAPDPDETDALVKLQPDQNLNLAGRAVIIHGVSSSTTLPDSVGTIGDLSPAQSLPIACGILMRVSTESSDETTDTI